MIQFCFAWFFRGVLDIPPLSYKLYSSPLSHKPILHIILLLLLLFLLSSSLPLRFVVSSVLPRAAALDGCCDGGRSELSMLVLTRVARYRIIHPVMATETQVRKGGDEGERRVYPVVCIVCVCGGGLLEN